MRLGLPWRVTVLASLLLLLSGQFCMLTTCLPRMARAHAGAHACCHTERTAPTSTPVPSGAMPCGQSVVLLDASAHETAAPIVQTVAWIVTADVLVTPAARRMPRAADDTGPPLARRATATSGLRAPPQA